MVYLAGTAEGGSSSYGASYFFDEYKAQYGKTYLEDFDSIKQAGKRRIAVITSLAKKKGALLDVGCAYGPFLQAAHEAHWAVQGVDVSQDAVSYVKNTLGFPAICGDFAAAGLEAAFGTARFDAVTAWFVVEHFEDLGAALAAVSRALKPGGVFAFSTPSGSGVSARFNRERFFRQSPRDHATVWEPAGTAQILRPFGFRVAHIVSTGHHPERFFSSPPSSPSPLLFSALHAASRALRLGDTFEVYAVKDGV
jgi:2-polyprenyl-3-methyl-5-hydroxy-6-metoxy-1,4-benzoquinol methylase